VFPYKSSSNRFALDKGSFFSADIYCLLLKNESSYSYNFLLRLLNSRVYEYYFKTFAKKLGDNLYEYYPNNLMKLRIPPFTNIEEETDAFLSKYFELTSSEMSIIKQYSKD
jgi:adenine-specific DNA-methyltransferase